MESEVFLVVKSENMYKISMLVVKSENMYKISMRII